MQDTERSPRTIRLLTALLLVGMFAAGVLTGGGLCHWLLVPPRPPWHGEHGMRGRLPGPFGELGLTEDQEVKAQAVLQKHRPELDAILDETFPKVRAVHDTIEQEIRTFLTAEQQKKLDELKAARPERPRRAPDGPWGPRGPGGPAGPGGPGGPGGSPEGGPGARPFFP